MNNLTETDRDPLTGGLVEKELAMYVRYHGLTVDEARKVLAVTESYAARDAMLDQVKAAN